METKTQYRVKATSHKFKLEIITRYYENGEAMTFSEINGESFESEQAAHEFAENLGWIKYEANR